MSKPPIITFYSFRGGVGRSMAMLNAGILLARAGRRVLLVDLDLEAPGLSRLTQRTDLLSTEHDSEDRPGVLELMLDYLRTPKDSILGLEAEQITERMPEYLVELSPPMPDNPFAQGGRLKMLRAGRWEDYEQRLGRLHLGSRKFSELREPLARRLQHALRNAGDFDYVLVDSRTGLSDEGYLASKFLCDFLVVLSGLNEQNIAGTGRFLQHLAEWRREEAGPERVILIASPVCEYEDDPKAARKEQAESELAEEAGGPIQFTLELPYHPRLSLYEELVAVDWPDSGLGRAYHRLSEIIMRMTGDSFSDWSDRLQEALRSGQVEKAEVALRQCAAIDRERSIDLTRQLSGALGNLEDQQAEQVIPLFSVLADIDPHEPLHPFQAARLHRRASSDAGHRELALGALEKAMARVEPDNAPATAAIYKERAEILLEQQKYREAREESERAEDLFRELDDQESLAGILNTFAQAARFLGDYSAAKTALEEREQVVRDLGDHQGIAVTLCNLANLDCLRGDYEEARRRYEEGLEIFRELGDRREIAATLYALAELDRLRAKYGKARKGYEESLEIFRELGGRREIAVTLYGLAHLDRLMGKYEKARVGYEESLAIFRELGDRREIAAMLHSLADLYRLKGDYETARSGYEECLEIQRELGERRETSTTLHSMAHLDRLRGEYETARSGFEQCLEIQRALGDRREIAMTLRGVATLDRLKGEYEQAKERYEESLEILRQLGDRRQIAATLGSLAELYRLKGQYEKAREGYEESLQVNRDLKNPRGTAVTLHSLAHLDRLKGDYENARRVYEESLQIQRKLGNRRGIAVARMYLAATETALDPNRTSGELENAITEVRELGDPHPAVRGRMLLSEILDQRGDREGAVGCLENAIEEAEQHGFRDIVARGRAQLAVWLNEAGETKRAQELARQALPWFEEQNVEIPLVDEIRSILRSSKSEDVSE